jgi:iron complex outermembrane recepter protein
MRRIFARKHSRLAFTTSVAVIALASVVTPAAAQTTDKVPETDSQAPAAQTDDNTPIIVTGSRIARSRNDTVEPVQTLSSEQIEARGFNTLGQALNELPSFGVADSSPVGVQSSFGPGQSFVNFFGLGSQRTLTLVNGRRFVGSNTAAIFGPTGSGGDQVDLNIIPTKLIDRVETVAVGGAPIYGSDAIAGTINVILKRDYQGFELDAQKGISERGDAADFRVRALAGHNFGRLNVTVAGEYNESDGLLYTDRDLAGRGRYFDTRVDPTYAFSRQFYNDRRIPGISQTGTPLVGSFGYDLLGLNAAFAPRYQNQYSVYATAYGGAPAGTPFNMGVTGGIPTQALTFDASGNLVPINFGSPTSITNSSGGNGFSLTELSNLLTNTKRYSANMLLSYDVTDNVRFFGEAWYSHSEGTNLRDQPEYKSGFFDAPGSPAGDVLLSINNPFLNAASRALIQQSINNNPLSDQNVYGVAGQDYFYLGRANTDLTSGRVRGQVDIIRFVGGFDGTLNVLGDKEWKWEVVANYGRSKTKSVIPTIIEQNFLNAAGAITADNPNGIPCLAGLANSSAPTISSTCAPLNLFGSGVASQAARDYVTGLATPQSVNTQKDFTASLTGDLFKLPGGTFAFAIGVEHREEHTKFDPSSIYLGAADTDPTVDSNGDGDPTNDRTPYGQTVPMVPINAGYNTNEIFGEINADLVGPDMNVPMIRSLQFQGAIRYVDHSINGGAVTWTAGGRWETIGGLSFRGNYTHSIRSPSITESSAPAQSYFDFATDPCDSTEVGNGPNPSARQANCTAALTAAGLTPAQIANFDALSDDRSFTQAVAGSSALKNETANSWTVGAVFEPTFFRGFSIAADYVDIRVKGVISSFGADQVLSGCYDSTTYPGNEFCGRQLRDSSGQLSYIVTGYVNQDELRYRGIVATGSYRTKTPFLGAESAIGLSVNYQHMFELSSTTAGTVTETAGTTGYSKDKGVVSLTYDNAGFGLFLQAQYIGPAVRSLTNAPTYEPFNHENAIVFTNLGVTANVAERFQVRFNVDNLFDQAPPFPSAGTSDVYFRGALGRYFHAGATVRF